jgi:hypothetical protein
MEGSMPIDASSREFGASPLGRLPAHVIGFLGANLICAAAFIWGSDVVNFWRSGAWSPSAWARLLAKLLGSSFQPILASLDMASAIVCLVIGFALLMAGARLLRQTER